MRKLLVAISILILPWNSTVNAQRSATTSPPKPKVVATPTPEPKRSVMGRIFGRRDKADPTPVPVAKPVATPTPRPKSRPKPRTPAPKPSGEEKPSPKPKPAPAGSPETQPPAPPKTEADPTSSPAPSVPPATEEKPQASGKKSGKKGAAPKIDTAGMDDAAKFRIAKAAAQEDAAIKDLQAKAEGALTEPEAHAASLAYNKALFRKVREIEPSIDGFVDKLEDAMLKRLNSEKKNE